MLEEEVEERATEEEEEVVAAAVMVREAVAMDLGWAAARWMVGAVCRGRSGARRRRQPVE